MGLEIRYNEAENTHENVQFRRIAKGLKQFFEDKNWNGLLIANPECDDFSRFRADAILFYEKAFVIIDFKDYKGELYIPEDEVDFEQEMWYKESSEDLKKLKIKGGSHGNPFNQLKNYRTTFYRLLESNKVLSHYITSQRIQALNIFSGPLDEVYVTPGKFRYYHLCDENSLYNKLVDLNQRKYVKYCDEAIEILKNTFPSEVWVEHNAPTFKSEQVIEEVNVALDFEESLNSFLSTDESGILLLESQSTQERDNWVKHILGEINTFEISQIETLIHSSRIKKRVSNRSGIKSDSLFTTIYGGGTTIKDSEDGIEGNEIDELQEVVPIRKDDWLANDAVIVLHEAHLVTRSIHQSDLLRFGTGRLLEDLLSFIDLKNTNRKLVCIGDPYSLSYGSEKESALTVEALSGIGDFNINKFRSSIISDNTAIEKLKTELVSSINSSYFNKLSYGWGETLVDVDKDAVLELIRSWFHDKLKSEPHNCVLVYSNKDASKINTWVKSACLKNGSEINEGDLLIVHNNVQIDDQTGLGNPTRINNGDYLTVNKKLDEKIVQVQINQSKKPIALCFTKVSVNCISNFNKTTAEIWLFDNYFKNEDKLSKEEQIAFKVMISNVARELKKKNPFENSQEFRNLEQDSLLFDKQSEVKELEKRVNEGEKVKTKLKAVEVEINKIRRLYKRKYSQRIQHEVYFSNPLVNAVAASYGWAITVHKAIGASFENIIINANQGENKGVSNAAYYRWLYSGISTANSKGYILNHPVIYPMLKCVFDDSVEDGMISTSKKSKRELDFTFVSSKYDYSDIAAEVVNNVKIAISILKPIISENLFDIDSVSRLGDYQSSVLLKNRDSSKPMLSLIISNNGKGFITSVRDKNSIPEYSEFTETLVPYLVGKIEEEGNGKSNGNEEGFRKEQYELWNYKASKVGATILCEQNHSYHDVLKYSSSDGTVRFKTVYNGQGFFSKISILEKTNQLVSDKLKSILMDV